jgi:hypothetical protein
VPTPPAKFCAASDDSHRETSEIEAQEDQGDLKVENQSVSLISPTSLFVVLAPWNSPSSLCVFALNSRT